MAFGDNFDGTIGHFDGGLVVNRVTRHRHGLLMGKLRYCITSNLPRLYSMVHTIPSYSH
jgi:hypothetical protein